MRPSIDLIYQIDGKNLDDGIDIFDLSPSLLSLGTIIKRSNEILFPGGNKIDVYVKPFKRGSFLIDIGLIAQSQLQQIIDFFNSESGKQIIDLLKFVGLIVSTSGISLFEIIKFLKGKLAKVERISDNEVKMFSEENTNINAPIQTLNLYKDCTIQQNVYPTVKVLDKENIDKIESYIKEQKETTKVEIKKEDKNYFREYSSKVVILGEDKIKNVEEIVDLQIAKIWFEKKDRKWDFLWNGIPISASILDKDFFNKIDTGEKFAKGDTLKVKLNIIKKFDEDLKTFRNYSYEVLEVIKHISNNPGEQLDLINK